MKTLQSIHKALKNKGMLIFDNFDAKEIFGNFKRTFVQSARYKDKLYKRVSNSSWNLKTGWTWNWNAKYYIKENGKTKIIQDSSVLRAFTEDELRLFLKINGFETKKIMKEESSVIILAIKA